MLYSRDVSGAMKPDKLSSSDFTAPPTSESPEPVNATGGRRGSAMALVTGVS